jgi:hypothetical protein
MGLWGGYGVMGLWGGVWDYGVMGLWGLQKGLVGSGRVQWGLVVSGG